MRITFKKLLLLLKTPLGITVAAAILAFTPLALLSYLLVLFVAASFVPFKAGVITRLAVAFCLMTCMFGFIGAAAWVAGLALTVQVVLVLLILPLALIALIRKNKPIQNSTFGTNHHELLAAGLALAAIFFITLPILRSPNGGTLLRVISAGGDNSAHITMVKASDLNQGLAYGANNRVNQVPGAVSYPHTWHFSVAFFKWLLQALPLSGFDSTKTLLVIFYGSALLWFGLLVFLMTQCALRVGMFISRKYSVIATSVAILACAGVTIHWLLQLFTNGFQSQTASLLMLMAEVYLLAEAYNRPSSKRYNLLLLAAILAVGSTIMWTLLMPVAAAIVGVCVLQTALANKKLPQLQTILGFVGVSLFALFQPALIFAFPVGYEDGESLILQRGFINPTSIEALIIIAAICAIAALLHGRDKPQRVLFGSLGLALAFSTAIMTYQLYEIGELRYFYYKSTYAAIVLAGALLGATAYYFAYKLLGTTTKRTARLIASIVLATGVLVVWQVKDSQATQYLDGTLGGMNTRTASAILQQTARGTAVSSNTTFMGNCNRGDDIRANLFVAALSKDMVYKPNSFDQGHHDEAAIFKAIDLQLQTGQNTISIVSNDQAITAALKDYLGAHAVSPKLEIIDLDPDTQTETISQCPDRIRDIQKYPVQ
jgi:hypothetical protein